MCGIAGRFNDDPLRPVDRDVLEAMTDVVAHRGPDAAGHYVGPGIGLGHRRLSIIDLATGDQPLSNEDGTVWTVFNGEIYNFAEVRANLIARGHRFKTGSDTEIIVHGYEQWGERSSAGHCLSRHPQAAAGPHPCGGEGHTAGIAVLGSPVHRRRGRQPGNRVSRSTGFAAD